MTSNRILLANAKPLEDVAQDIFAGAASDNLVQKCPRSLQIAQQEFLCNIRRGRPLACGNERKTAPLEQ
jgi:hypothetical protein